MQLELDGTHRVTPVLQSAFAERNGVVSPDGRWLAYEANDSGRFEVSVRPFPDVNSGHWQVSAAGGTRPLWTRNGRELIYVSPTGALMSVGVARGPSWAAEQPVPVVKEGYLTTPVVDLGRTYDVAAGRALSGGQGRWHGPGSHSSRSHRRAALGRGTEAAGADTGLTKSVAGSGIVRRMPSLRVFVTVVAVASRCRWRPAASPSSRSPSRRSPNSRHSRRCRCRCRRFCRTTSQLRRSGCKEAGRRRLAHGATHLRWMGIQPARSDHAGERGQSAAGVGVFDRHDQRP